MDKEHLAFKTKLSRDLSKEVVNANLELLNLINDNICIPLINEYKEVVNEDYTPEKFIEDKGLIISNKKDKTKHSNFLKIKNLNHDIIKTVCNILNINIHCDIDRCVNMLTTSISNYTISDYIKQNFNNKLSHIHDIYKKNIEDITDILENIDKTNSKQNIIIHEYFKYYNLFPEDTTKKGYKSILKINYIKKHNNIITLNKEKIARDLINVNLSKKQTAVSITQCGGKVEILKICLK